ncbi:odorant receptor 13a-like [Vespula squamosa]|uniref:Odorant receptor 13a-like n=1 Tax=Vespula squamosa TaxID=30214 RepID=A0ABD2BHR4_VESSQ
MKYFGNVKFISKPLQTAVNNCGEICIMTNSSVEYKLPYKIKPLLKSNDAKSYAFGCIHEFLRTIIVISGLADIFEHCFNSLAVERANF